MAAAAALTLLKGEGVGEGEGEGEGEGGGEGRRLPQLAAACDDARLVTRDHGIARALGQLGLLHGAVGAQLHLSTGTHLLLALAAQHAVVKRDVCSAARQQRCAVRAAQPEPRELPRAALAAQAAVARVLEATVTDHAARAGGFEHERAAQHGAFLAAELDGHPQPCLRAAWLVERARARQVLAAAQHDALPRHGDAQRRDEGGTVVRHDQRDVAHDRQEQVARRSDALDRGGGGAAQARVRGGGQCAQDVGPVRDGRHRPSLSWSSSFPVCAVLVAPQKFGEGNHHR